MRATDHSLSPKPSDQNKHYTPHVAAGVNSQKERNEKDEKKGGKYEGKICSDEVSCFIFWCFAIRLTSISHSFFALRKCLHVRSYSFQEGAQTYFPWQQTICSSLTPFLHHTWWHGPDITAVSTYHMCCYTRHSSHAVTTKILKIWERGLFWKIAINDKKKKSIFGKNKLIHHELSYPGPQIYPISSNCAILLVEFL